MSNAAKYNKQVFRLYGKAFDKALPTKDIQLRISDHMIELN